MTSFAEGWLAVDDLEAVQPDMLLFPEFSEGLRQDFAAEMRLFLKSVLLEDAQRAGAADGRLHVRQRAARAPLRHRRRRRPAVPARAARGSRAPRAARQGLDAAAHVVRRPHVAGAARRVGARQAHGHAADSAAARRRDELEHARGRAAEDGARAARAAPQGRELQRVPRRHRPVRLGARELHGDWRLARLSTRTPKRRSTRARSSRAGGPSTAPSRCATRCSSATTSSCKR